MHLFSMHSQGWAIRCCAAGYFSLSCSIAWLSSAMVGFRCPEVTSTNPTRSSQYRASCGFSRTAPFVLLLRGRRIIFYQIVITRQAVSIFSI